MLTLNVPDTAVDDLFEALCFAAANGGLPDTIVPLFDDVANYQNGN